MKIMAGNLFDGKKGRSLDNIIAKLSKVRTPRKGNRILLVSEKNNACLSLSSEESEDGEADLHQCGHCRRMFTNLSFYITHKIEKPCRAGLANRDTDWQNETLSFSNEATADENLQRSAGGQADQNEKDGAFKVLSQELQKRKHDRKGLARRLNVTGSPDSADPMSSPDDVNRLDSQMMPPSCEGENPVIVVVNETGTEKELNADLESRLNGTEVDSRNKDIPKTRRISPTLHSQDFKMADQLPPEMPFLERIRTNNPHEGVTVYPATGFPNFPPRITDKMQNVFPSQSGDGIRENVFPGERIPHENHRDMRKSWSQINKKNSPYSNHVESDMHGCYPPPAPHPLYNAPFPTMHYSHPYLRQSNASMAQFGKPCCSSEHSVPPNYQLGRYTMSPVSSERAHRKIYEIDASVYTTPYSSIKTQAAQPHAKKPREEIGHPKSSESSQRSNDPPVSHLTSKKQEDVSVNKIERTDGAGNEEENTKKESEGKPTHQDERTQDERRDPVAASEVPPQLVKTANGNSKENYDSPSSSLRPESFETNSQTGSLRSRESTPASSISGSPQSSSNHSIDPTISPSQVYDGGVLRVGPDIAEDASKQSMESASPMTENPEKRAPIENSASPTSERCANDESSLGDRDDSINQGMLSFKNKRPHSVDIAVDRPIDENPNETSSPPSDPSWRHSKQVYRCPLCAKIFPFKSKLQRHVLVHTGIKPYKCSVCGRGFTQQIDLQRHLTRHTGEKPFKCHLCKAQFIRADNLRKHAKDTHFVSIEEPIRKRRRKTTGSDTVLPPLEVAIAMAINETEKNGGRVLGRSSNRTGRNARRDRMLSIEEEQRRMEQSAETFSRPTMGSIPSHPFSGGPPSMGFPHGPAMPPFSRLPSEMYDPAINERPSSPPHPILPPRYHPGSMVFQPRSMTDRYLDRPYFSRPPNELPAMYWSSPPRHAHLSPTAEGSRIPPRERFNSETSEGASSVFEGREDGKNPEGVEDGIARGGDGMVVSSGDARFVADRPYMALSERVARSSESRISEERISATPERKFVPAAESEIHHSPNIRMPHISEDSSPRGPDDKAALIHAERSRVAEERSWSAGGRVHPPAEQIPRSYDDNVYRLPDEALKYDEKVSRSPAKVIVSKSDQRQLSPAARFQDPVDIAVVQMDDRAIQGHGGEAATQGDMRMHLRIPEPWSRYDRKKLNVSPNKVANYNPDNVSPNKTHDIPVSPEGKNGFRTQHEEFRMVSS